jgi:hypothetical protein
MVAIPVHVLTQGYQDPLIFHALGSGIAAFFEVPLVLATAIQLIGYMPSLCMFEYRRWARGATATVGHAAGAGASATLPMRALGAGELGCDCACCTKLASSSTAAALQWAVGAQVPPGRLASDGVLWMPRGWRGRAAFCCVVCLVVHFAAHVVLHGPQFLKRQAVPHRHRGRCNTASSSGTVPSSLDTTPRATRSTRAAWLPLSHSLLAAHGRISSWANHNAFVGKLLGPVELGSRMQALETRLFMACMALPALHILLPLACTPIALYTLTT